MYDTQRKYNWSEIQVFYNLGNSWRACQKRFGMTSGTIGKARKRGELVTYSRITPLKDILIENSSYNRGHLKKRLIKEGILENKCILCKLPPTWEDKDLIMVIDHTNGIKDDNRLENLRLLCPNCNSQTSTFSGRNTKKKLNGT